MGMILDRLQTELEKTRKDGKFRRVHADRNKFIIEVPQAMQDPRFQLMPQSRPTVIIEFEKNEHITAGELLELCSRDPENPLSSIYRLAVMGLNTEHVLAVRCDQLDQLRAKQAIATSQGGGPEESGRVAPQQAPRDNPDTQGAGSDGAEGYGGFTPETALAGVEASQKGKVLSSLTETSEMKEVQQTENPAEGEANDTSADSNEPQVADREMPGLPFKNT